MSGNSRRRPFSRAFAGALLVALLLISGTVMGGCKYTDVMTEHIEDEQIGVLDPDAEPLDRDVPGAPEDPTRTSSHVSDSERIDDQTQTLPDYDKQQNNDNQTDNRDKKEDSDNQQNATKGDDESQDDGDNDTAGVGDKTTDQGSGNGTGQGDGTTDDTNPGGNTDTGNPNQSAGIGGEGKVFDPTGSAEDLPENTKTVAAAGQYATIVEMLAGKGALTVADSDWISCVTSKGLFPGEGVETLSIGWTGDADSGYAIDTAAIVAAKPDAILVDGVTASLTDADQQALMGAGINVITVPVLGTSDTADENIVAAVNTVGELLRGANCQYDTAKMASMYETMHDNTIQSCKSSNGGYSFKSIYGTTYSGIYQGTSISGEQTTEQSSTRFVTSFVDGWTYDIAPSSTAVRSYGNATLYLNGEVMDSSDGAGTSATGTTQNFMLLDYYLQVGGVTNNAYESAKPALTGEGATRSYLVVPGDTKNLITSSSAFVSRTAPSALWFSPTTIDINSSWSTVGNSDYPCIIARTDELASNIVRSANKVGGLYNVGQPYTVRTCPSGLSGSWSVGTVESFLMSPWAFCAFQSGGDLSAAETYANDFYSTFYRYGASASTVIDDFDTSYPATCPTN